MVKQFIKRNGLLLAWGAVFVAIACGMTKNVETLQASESKPIEIHEVVINPQDSVKQELIDEVASYMNQNHPNSKVTPDSLVEVCLKHDFDITFAIAQGTIESGMGVAGRAKRTNSVWNVGAYDGKPQPKKFIYQDADSSIEPYVLLVKNKYLGKLKTLDDLMKNYVALSGHRYAGNRSYESHLRGVYNRINKRTRIGELQNEYRDMC